ncbi:MAG: hypothetical protein Fur0036_19050 [Fimbriimonadaceae bacterium]
MPQVIAALGMNASLYATIRILYDIFETEGFGHLVLALICGLYAIYWLFTQYEETDKIAVIICMVLGIVLPIIAATMLPDDPEMQAFQALGRVPGLVTAMALNHSGTSSAAQV